MNKSREEDSREKESGPVHGVERQGKVRRETISVFLPELDFLFPETSVPVSVKDKDSQDLTLLIPCIVLGILLFLSLVVIAILLLRAKGRYGKCDIPRATGQEMAVVRHRLAPVCETWKRPAGTTQLRLRENLLMMGKIFPACPVVSLLAEASWGKRTLC